MKIRLSACVLLAWGLSGDPAAALELSPGNCENPLDCARNSVVSVLPVWPASFTRNGEPEGSGIVLHDGKLIATSDHVLGPASEVRVRTLNGQILDADIVLRNKATDIALIAIDKTLSPITNGSPAAVAAKSCAIGNSFGLDISITCGVVSATDMSGTGFNRIEDFIQTDAPVNPGMSGGALVNEKGQLLGMLSAIFTRQSDANIGVNFAVSNALLETVLNSYLSSGSFTARHPGVLTRPANPSTTGGYSGAEIVRVNKGSAESKAGVRIGDVILEAAGRRIKRAGAYEAAIALAKSGKALDLLVLRGKDVMTIRMITE